MCAGNHCEFETTYYGWQIILEGVEFEDFPKCISLLKMIYNYTHRPVPLRVGACVLDSIKMLGSQEIVLNLKPHIRWQIIRQIIL